jgi:Ca2+/Na+ antiporter
MKRVVSLVVAVAGAMGVLGLTTSVAWAAGGLPTLSLTMNGSSITAGTTSVPEGAVNVVSTVSGEKQASRC